MAQAASTTDTMNFAGELETHLTVQVLEQVLEAEQIEALRRWGEAHGLKCVHIVLERGATPSQPMLTRHAHGDLRGEMQHANRLRHALEAHGFAVSRVKIEAAPWNADVPRLDEEARAEPGKYFEHHIKLLLAPDADIAALALVAQRHGAHLSRNARRERGDGHERFVTQRCFGVGQEEARRRLDLLRGALADLGHPILEEEQEYVVFDSNLALDDGWLK